MKPFCTLALLFVAPFLAAQSAEKVEVKFAPKKGETFWFVQTQHVEEDVKVGARTLKRGFESNHVVSITVTDVDLAGIVTLDAKVVRVHGTMQLPKSEFVYDSAKPAAEAGEYGGDEARKLWRAATAMADISFTATVGANGVLVEVKDVEQVLAKALEKGGEMARSFGGGLSAKAVSSHVEAAIGKLPGKPAGPGDSWERKDLHSQGIVETRTTSTLANIEPEQVTIAFEGTFAKPPREEKPVADAGQTAEQALPQEMSIEKGTISGKQTVARNDGFVIRSDSKSSIEIKMPNPAGGEVEMAQTAVRTVTRASADAAIPEADGPKKEEPKMDGEAPKTGGEKK